MSRYSPSYEIEVRHPGLNAYRHIRGKDRRVVEQKAAAQLAKWDEQWEKRKEAERKQEQRAKIAADREAKKAHAETRTESAQAVLDEASQLLSASLAVDDAIDWAELLDTSSFSEPEPSLGSLPPAPKRPTTDDFRPQIGLLGFLIPAVKRKRVAKADEEWRGAEAKWHRATKVHEKRVDDLRASFEENLESWGERRDGFEREKDAHNRYIKELEARHVAGDPEAVEEHADLVLTRSTYPSWYNRDWELSFEAQTGILVVNYRLPNVDDVPTLREIKYVQTRDTFDEKHISQAERKRTYDSIIYQICLRTLHELFEADRTTKNLEAVVFNGITEFLSPQTGQQTTNCICSLQAKPDVFEAINLDAVDPKACFKGLKGVSASSMSQMAPVAPLMALEREDARFVQGEDVASTVTDGENIAAMNWQDFEHLIRQVFEAEFSHPGCEVKVTRGSRDGGVDAIAFDPDPIRGGKIVIQAKRYTNTVGVEAVRDLYGTVVNEGATKGILVTTAQYGPDARSFAAGKPIALIDGPNLLHMLGNQGVSARIDLVEAKRMLADA